MAKKSGKKKISIESKKVVEEVEEKPGTSEDEYEEMVEDEGDNHEEEEVEVDEEHQHGDESETEVYSRHSEEDRMSETDKKIRKTGVLYFSAIPPKFNPTRLKNYFEQVAPGMIGRVYLEKNKNSKAFDQRYQEGWLEIKSKKLAKKLALAVNSSPVGGKKRDYASGVLWHIKYLNGFKWVHLVEQLEYEKTVETKRMQAEMGQIRRIAAHFEEQVEKGEQLKKLEKKVLQQGGLWDKFQRQIAQKKPIKKRVKKEKKAAKDEEVMKMIFG